MHFNKPSLLWLLLILIPLIFLGIYALVLFARFEVSPYFRSQIFRYSSLPNWKRRSVANFLYLFSFALAVLALSEPFITVQVKDSQYSNVRLIFVVDVSRSMVYAEDVEPNRLAAAKKYIKDIYNSLDGTYESSILPFAGDVNPYFCPLTTSRVSFLGMLEELDWRSAPTLGTDLTVAMQAVVNIYVKKEHIDKTGLNIIVLISDGGKEEAMATNRQKLLQVVRELSLKNFRIYTIGVGGTTAAPLVIRDDKGNFVRYLLEENKVATSQLDEEILQQVATLGHGEYYNLNSADPSFQVFRKIVLENRKVEGQRLKFEKIALQQYLFAGIVCILIFCLLLNKV
jgi:Ca-activated chloride channel family protein